MRDCGLTCLFSLRVSVIALMRNFLVIIIYCVIVPGKFSGFILRDNIRTPLLSNLPKHFCLVLGLPSLSR